jgi:tRNA nucleotidyltransferase (CCA-adding enzyme)
MAHLLADLRALRAEGLHPARMVEYTAQLVGKSPRIIDLGSGGWAYLQAGLMWLLPNPPLSPDNLRSMEVDSVTDGSHDYPGWQPDATRSRGARLSLAQRDESSYASTAFAIVPVAERMIRARVAASMQIFTVGGAIRDELLGLPVKDRDYVVVGASPPRRCWHAVSSRWARISRSSCTRIHDGICAGAHRAQDRSWLPGLCLSYCSRSHPGEDLARRDLTINAIARAADGSLIDPYRGIDDLAAQVLRHVGPAFTEDPVRVLRLARFAARFPEFTVAPETLALMRSMVACGELDHLVAERVWQELAKGLMEVRPSRMFEVLRAGGALAPPAAGTRPSLRGRPARRLPSRSRYRRACADGRRSVGAARCALPVRWAALLHDLGKGTHPTTDLPRHPGHEERSVELAGEVCARLKVPVDCRDLALLVARYHGKVHRAHELTAADDRQASRKYRRPAPARPLRATARSLRLRLPWPPRLAGAPLPGSGSFPTGAAGGAQRKRGGNRACLSRPHTDCCTPARSTRRGSQAGLVGTGDLSKPQQGRHHRQHGKENWTASRRVL